MMKSQFIKLTIAAAALLMIPKRSSRNADDTTVYRKPSNYQDNHATNANGLNDKYNQ